MTSGVFIPVCCIFFSFLLLCIYFSKKRINTIETRLYTWLIIVNFIGLIIEIPCYWMVRHFSDIPIVATIILRGYLVYLLTWLIIFTVYVHFIADCKTEISNIYRIKKIWIYIYWISLIIILLLPMNYYYDGIVGYTYGPSVYAVYIISGICIVTWFISMFRNYKHLKQKRYLPLFFFIVIGAILATIQLLYPGILLMTAMETFISFMMYFTIENPDIQLLRQLHKVKEYAEHSNNEKSSFLFNITQQLREPLKNISRLSKESLMEDEKTIIKKNLTEIKYASNNALTMVNSVLDISELENRKIPIEAHKYQPANIFNSLARISQIQLKEKNIELRFNYDQSIPEYLNGDSLRIKQIVSTLLENAITHTKEGFIEFNINSIVKYDICRLIISVEDSGKGIEVETLNRLFEKEKINQYENYELDDSQKNLAFIKTLIDLIGGTINVISEPGRGSKFTVVIDQKISEIKKTNLEKAVKQYEDIYLNKNQILIVTTNEKRISKLLSVLKKCHLDYDIVTTGQECLEKIRNKEIYQLILLDEELPKLSSIHTFEKLRTIPNFHTPVVLMTEHKDIETKDSYINIGFYDTIEIPIHKEQVKQILDKYIK